MKYAKAAEELYREVRSDLDSCPEFERPEEKFGMHNDPVIDRANAVLGLLPGVERYESSTVFHTEVEGRSVYIEIGTLEGAYRQGEAAPYARLRFADEDPEFDEDFGGEWQEPEHGKGIMAEKKNGYDMVLPFYDDASSYRELFVEEAKELLASGREDSGAGNYQGPRSPVF